MYRSRCNMVAIAYVSTWVAQVPTVYMLLMWCSEETSTNCSKCTMLSFRKSTVTWRSSPWRFSESVVITLLIAQKKKTVSVATNIVNFSLF